MKKILIINPFGIGDCLFTTALIGQIKKAWGNSFIGYWCNRRTEAILQNVPGITRTYALSRGDLKKIFQESFWKGIVTFLNLYRGLKQEKFEICLDFSLDHRYSLLTKLIGIKKRVGFNYKNRGKYFLTDKIDIEGYSVKHIVDYYLDLLKFLNITPVCPKLELSCPQDVKLKAMRQAGIQEGDLIIGVAPGAGASWGENSGFKRWPAIRFAQASQQLIGAHKAKIILIGDQSEAQLSEAIFRMMKDKPVNLTGKTSLLDLIGLISSLNILITNDGGPLHLASALGVKTVSIFGPVDEKVYGPYQAGANHIVIKKDNLSCRPCYKNFRMPACGKDRECVNSITVADVVGAARRLI